MKGLGLGITFRIWMLAFATLVPVTVLADGMVIPQRAYALPDIPDQRALIHYDNGIETLVIETSFVGQGTNFAWVVPLPAMAKIEPASTGLFPTLQVIFQPKIVLSVKHYWLALPIAVVVIFLIRVLRRESFFVLALLGLLFLATMVMLPIFGEWFILPMAVLVLFLIGIFRLERRSVVALLILFFLVIVLMFPFFALTRSRGGMSGSTVANVRVLDRQNAGLFDTVIIKSTDPTALLSWLNENGFSAPTNIAPVVADYVRDGWVFAAARLRREVGDNAPLATHPLAFTFKSAKPVYPLRLTGKGTASCRVDLYVFGPGRAAAPGFAVQRCEAPQYQTEVARPQLETGGLRIRHQELAKLVTGAPVATKLSATLNASGMARDAYVSWGTYWPSGGKRYSTGAALTVSGNVAALLFMGLFVVWWVLSRTKCITGFRAQQWGPWLAPVAVAVGIAVYLTGLPRVEASSMRVTRVSYGGLTHEILSIGGGNREGARGLRGYSSRQESATPIDSGRVGKAVPDHGPRMPETRDRRLEWNSSLDELVYGRSDPVRSVPRQRDSPIH